jgi:hypothetical protein
MDPSISVSGSTVVEVHNGFPGTGPGKMWYHVGQISGSTIHLAPSYPYDPGSNPSVALFATSTGGLFGSPIVTTITLVEVHNGANLQMWSKVGKVVGSTISWVGPSINCGSGWNPKVAIYGLGITGYALEVHNASTSEGPMSFYLRQISDPTVGWGPSYDYDQGFNPSVTAADVGFIEVHNGAIEVGPMWYHVADVYTGIP